MSADALARRIDAKRVGREWRTFCPLHRDEHPSLDFTDGQQGGIVFTCRSSGCDSALIAAHFREAHPELFPRGEHAHANARRVIERTYPYTDAAGELLFEVVRFDPKDFRQRRPDGNGGWVWNLDGVRRVLYRLPRVIETAKAGGVVYVVEGEKDAEALERLKLTATCNAGGAGKWRPEYAEALRGAKGAVILPDNDQPGHAHALGVARSLHAAGVPVKVLELPGLPEKGDVSDWLAAGGTKPRLFALQEAAPLWEPAAEALTAEGSEANASAVLVRVSDVESEAVEWLWMHRIPRGKVTVLDGDPGLGKSTVTLDLAARVSKGRAMPSDEREREPAGVVLLTAEDGIGDTIRPRLEAAGADLERVAVLTAVRDDEGKPRLPVLPDDVGTISGALRGQRAGLLVIDPLMAFLAGRVDSHRDQDVRGALHLLADLAEREHVAVLIVRHLNKAGGGHPIYRGGGSIGIIGAARAGLLVAPDPKDDTRRVVAVSKSNLGPVPPSLAYRLVQSGGASRIEWEGIAEGCSASDLLAAQRDDGEGAGPREEAEAFLLELLGAGPVPARKVRSESEGAGLAWATMRRAADRIGVKRDKAGMTAGWYWSLSADAEDAHSGAEGAEDAHPQSVSTFGKGEHLRAPAPAEEEIIS